MSDTVRLVLAILTAFRLNWTLLRDDGPFDIIFHLRRICGAYDLDPLVSEPMTSLGRWWHCPYCVGIASALVGGALYLWRIDLLLLWGGIAGALMLLIRWRSWD